MNSARGSCPFNENVDNDIELGFYLNQHNTININSYVSYPNDDFFNYIRVTVLIWHINDTIHQIKIDRNTSIETYQGNTNPCILDSTLAQRMFN